MSTVFIAKSRHIVRFSQFDGLKN